MRDTSSATVSTGAAAPSSLAGEQGVAVRLLGGRNQVHCTCSLPVQRHFYRTWKIFLPSSLFDAGLTVFREIHYRKAQVT